jgi:hypothetical protein
MRYERSARLRALMFCIRPLRVDAGACEFLRNAERSVSRSEERSDIFDMVAGSP